MLIEMWPVLAEQAKFRSIYGQIKYLFKKVWVNCMK